MSATKRVAATVSVATRPTTVRGPCCRRDHRRLLPTGSPIIDLSCSWVVSVGAILTGISEIDQCTTPLALPDGSRERAHTPSPSRKISPSPLLRRQRREPSPRRRVATRSHHLGK